MRNVWKVCCPCRPLSWPSTCPPVLRVVRTHQSRCLFGCACGTAPAANGSRDVGACGHAVANAQTVVFMRGQVVESQRSVQRTARRDHTSPLFVLADFLLPSKRETTSSLRVAHSLSLSRAQSLSLSRTLSSLTLGIVTSDPCSDRTAKSYRYLAEMFEQSVLLQRTSANE